MEAAIRTGDKTAVQQHYASNDPNGKFMVNGKQKTPLIWAIECGKYSIADLLIKLGADPNALVPGNSPLRAAFGKGSAQFIKWLLEHGANANTPQGTALHYYLKTNLPRTNPELLQTLLEKGVDINIGDDKNHSPLLLLAARLEITTPALFKALIDAGANTEHKDLDGRDAFAIAEIAGNHTFMLKFASLPGFKVLEHGGQVFVSHIEDRVIELEREIESIYNDHNNEYGPPPQPSPRLTSAHSAYSSLQSILTQKLEEERKELFAQIKTQLTNLGEGASNAEKTAVRTQALEMFKKLTTVHDLSLLEYVILNDDPELIALLPRAGVDLNAHVQNGKTCIELALMGENPEMVKALVTAGADINKVNSAGNPPISYAVKFGNHDALDYLLEHGADINKGFLLGIAVYKHNHEMVDHLIERGINKDIIYDGETALTYALTEKFYDMAEHLIALGADVNISDTQYAPIHYAILQGQPEMLRILLEAGADPKKPAADGDTPAAMAARTNPQLTSILEDYVAPPMWKGFSRADAERFDTLFETEAPAGERPPAENYSCCPVCLKYVERETGCMYMTHSCAALGRHHAALLAKYGNQYGQVEWCTVCGRIANGGHRHYELGPWDGAVPPALPGGHPFEADCRTSNHGGGIPEKVMRARAIREEGKRLNDLIGQITEREAYMRLVQAGWDGPTTQPANTIATIMADKKWNRPSSNYPAAKANNANIVPNANDPSAYDAPVVYTPGEEGYESNSVSLSDDIPVIVFKHKDKDGAMYTHSQIGVDSLITELQTSGSKGLKCFVPECGGMMWPGEVAMAFADPKLAASITDEQRAVLAAYRDRFNRTKAAAGATGGRRTRRNKSRPRK